MEPLISVIIPVYNVAPYIEKCIHSVFAQTYQNLQIILVDDGSTDDSGKLCDELQQEDSRVEVIHKENGGVSDAKNVGMQQAKGEYILYMDPDDYIDPSMIDVLYKQLVQEDADVSSCNIMNVYQSNETPQYANPNVYAVYTQEEFLREYLKGQIVPGSMCNKLMKQSIAEQLSFPVGKIYEDAFYHYDLIQVAQKFVVNTKPLYYYYHREKSLTSDHYQKRDLACIEVYELFASYVQKHYPQLEKEAFFRKSQSYFVVFDKLLHTASYETVPEYQTIKRYLKQYAWKIFKNDIFQKGRRIAALALKLNVELYKQLMFANEAKHKQMHQ